MHTVPPVALGMMFYVSCIGLAMLIKRSTALRSSSVLGLRAQQHRSSRSCSSKSTGAATASSKRAVDNSALTGSVVGVLELMPPCVDSTPFKRTLINDALVSSSADHMLQRLCRVVSSAVLYLRALRVCVLSCFMLSCFIA
jgi:hypothetical protein